MKALVLHAENTPLHYGEWQEPAPREDQVIVELKAAGLNRRDVFITQGLYPKITYPIILGSDGVGVQGEREVIINPSIGWGDDPLIQAEGYHIVGLPENGTFAERIAIEKGQLYDKPPHLSWEQAAALPLAALTAYRALFTRGSLQAGERVLISGVGGGVALFALQFALAAGAEVYVTSGSEEKLDKATAMGAKGGANYRSESWDKELAGQSGGFDLIIDSAGGDGFARLLKTCRPGARVVTYGGTRGYVNKLSPQLIFWRQLTIMGTTMGTDREFADMLAFVNRHQIVPVVDRVFDLAEGPEAFARMDQGLQFGKIVFRIYSPPTQIAER